jgi:hypothetical protein
MAFARRIIASGIAPVAGSNITGDVAIGLTATGSTQGTALVLGAANNFFTTVAASTGCQIPADMSNPGDKVYVYNGGASTLSVYGQTGDAIASGAVNAAFSVGANKGCFFIRASATLLGVVLSA